MNRSRATLCLLAVLLGMGSAMATEPPASSLQTGSPHAIRDGDSTIFEIEFVLPQDADVSAAALDWWNPGWPRVPRLESDPPWQAPCYLHLPDAELGQQPGLTGAVTFIGRCPAGTSSLALTLTYPVAEGVRRLPVTVALADALPWQIEKPLEKWANAQAFWFDLLAARTGDIGGFFTYAATQTRREFVKSEAATQPSPMRRFSFDPHEQFYNVTTGALAVQESLQLDRMLNVERDRADRTVPIAEIPAVVTRSHPFVDMRGDRAPEHSALAQVVPADFYYAHFENLAAFYELLDFAGDWGGSLLRLAQPVGQDHGVRARLHRQLCLPDTALARLLGPAVVAEMALTGSDPYLVEGSDLSVIFQVKQKQAFQLALDAHFKQAQQEFADATADTVTYEGVTIERLVDARRRVSCQRCWIGDLCIYSNSLAAVKAIIDTQQTRRPALAGAADFQYMRAVVFPRDPQAEDGFVYLSDAFIRRLVGPELRIKEKRRLEVLTSLKMISNAALYHGYRYGPEKPTLSDLIAHGCLRNEDLFDPDGGEFTWDPAQALATNSRYGELSFLTPLLEIAAERATAKESEGYRDFRERYQSYWRRYFDPIGVRLHLRPTLRLETCILPLIDQSTYDDFVDLAGGAPIRVRIEQFTPQTLLRVVMHFNDGRMKQQALAMMTASTGTNAASDWVGDWLTFWVEDTDALRTLVRREAGFEEGDEDPGREVIDIFNTSLVAGIHVRNKLSLAAFLVSLKTMLDTVAPNTVIYNTLAPYREVSIVQLAPNPQSELGSMMFGSSQPAATPATTAPATAPAASEAGPALYYAIIGDGFYLSTQAAALRNLVDRLAEPPAATDGPITANLLLYAAPGAMERARATVSCLLESHARQIAVQNLVQVWLLGRCGVLENQGVREAAPRYLGFQLVCPDGGDYSFDAKTRDAVSVIHGPLSQPRRLEELPANSPLGRVLDAVQTLHGRLHFTPEGLMTVVEIERR